MCRILTFRVKKKTTSMHSSGASKLQRQTGLKSKLHTFSELCYYWKYLLSFPGGKVLSFQSFIPSWSRDLLWLMKSEARWAMPLGSRHFKSHHLLLFCSLFFVFQRLAKLPIEGALWASACVLEWRQDGTEPWLTQLMSMSKKHTFVNVSHWDSQDAVTMA